MTEAESFSRKQVAGRFSAGAARYAALSPLQAAAAERLASYLEGSPAPERLLEVGCGTGHLTERLARRWPGAELHALDIASRMIEHARDRVGATAARVHWIAADIFHHQDPRPFDWIVSSSTLQWLDPLGEAMKRFYADLVPGGLLAFAMMVDGTLGELREARLRAVPAHLPRGRLPDAGAVRTALDRAGFLTVCFDGDEVRERYASAYALLQRLHDQGVTGGEVSRADRPLTRGELARLAADYETHYRDGASVYATYCLLYVLARKPS
jgi:malonyl-CoA O-methyltransferase